MINASTVFLLSSQLTSYKRGFPCFSPSSISTKGVNASHLTLSSSWVASCPWHSPWSSVLGNFLDFTRPGLHHVRGERGKLGAGSTCSRICLCPNSIYLTVELRSGRFERTGSRMDWMDGWNTGPISKNWRYRIVPNPTSSGKIS